MVLLTKSPGSPQEATKNFRAEILAIFSLLFWSKRWNQKDISKLTDLWSSTLAFTFSYPALKSALHCAIIIFTGYFYRSRISFCYINDIFLFLSCCRRGKEIRFCDWWLVLWEKTEEKKHGSLSIRSSSLTAKVIASLEMSGKRKLN